MNDQLKFTHDGAIKGEHEHKVEMAIQRLKTFEPPDEPYYLCFSGGGKIHSAFTIWQKWQA